jgi:voltage-gated potassium channel
MRPSRRLRRTIDRFLEDPASIKNAARMIIGATLVAVVVGGVVVWLLDHKEYPNLGRALWFTLQTVTTVGYGDVTPTSVVGRAVGAVVMLTAIGFITIVTAAITSTFVEAARRKADKAAEAAETAEADRTGIALAAITARLDEMDRTLKTLVAQSGPVSPASQGKDGDETSAGGV